MTTTFIGDTKPLVDTILEYRRGLDVGISMGMHLSVMCSEDAPRMNPAQASLNDHGTALGDYPWRSSPPRVVNGSAERFRVTMLSRCDQTCRRC